MHLIKERKVGGGEERERERDKLLCFSLSYPAGYTTQDVAEETDNELPLLQVKPRTLSRITYKR